MLRPWDQGHGRKLWENTDDELSENENENPKNHGRDENSRISSQEKKPQKNSDKKELIEKRVEPKRLSDEENDLVEKTTDTEKQEVEDEDSFQYTIDAKTFDLVKVIFELLFRKTFDLIFSLQPAPSVCTLCDEEGHSKANCPNEELPELEELPPYPKEWDEILTKILKKIPGYTFFYNLFNCIHIT